MRPLRFGGDAATAAEPNVVVDGSPNDGTVLTLTHWPGFQQPDGYHFDLSAEMAFHYLDEPIDHPVADIVTNNHFDQDGLVGIHALVNPELSLDHRELLIDVASAGDFATFRDRRAARASMVIDAYADADRSPGKVNPEFQLVNESSSFDSGKSNAWLDDGADERALCYTCHRPCAGYAEFRALVGFGKCWRQSDI